eukprot:gene3528-6146_t
MRLLDVRRVHPRPWYERVLSCGCAVGIFAATPAFSGAFNLAVFSGIGVLMRPLFRRVTEQIRSRFYRFVNMFVCNIGNTKVLLYGDIPCDENQISFVNHQCDVDWLVLTSLLRVANADGRMAFMLKNTLKYVPLFGWFWWMSGFVYVRKSWQHDEQRIKCKLHALAESDRKYAFVIFPEGTRYTLEKVTESNEFASSRGYPEMKHVLTPRSKGFATSIQSLYPSLESVYDITIAYTTCSAAYVRPVPPSLFLVLNVGIVGREYDQVHVHVKRYDAKTIPKDNAGLDSWLRERFIEKDRRLHRFHQGYGFDGKPQNIVECPTAFALNLGGGLSYQNCSSVALSLQPLELSICKIYQTTQLQTVYISIM